MRQSTGSSNNSNVMPPVASLETSGVNVVEEAKMIDALSAEYRNLQRRMKEIAIEVQERFKTLNSVAPQGMLDEIADMGGGRRSRKIVNPRPLDDKLSIAAGRAIVRGMQQKKSAEYCKQEGIRAATQTAQKYGLDALPVSILALIDKKIKERFNL